MFDIVDKNKWLASLVIAAIIGYLGSLWWRGVLDDVRLANVMGYVWSVGMALLHKSA